MHRDRQGHASPAERLAVSLGDPILGSGTPTRLLPLSPISLRLPRVRTDRGRPDLVCHGAASRPTPHCSIGGLEQTLPFMIAGEHGEPPLAPCLQQVIRRLTGQERWTDFLAYGSQTAREFSSAWAALSSEASAIWSYLGEEPSGILAAPVTSAGGCCTDGSTRTKTVQQREALRHKLLERALSIHPDRNARPVTVFQNIARLQIPSPHT